MGIFDRFPYSSTHEMNLDFMLGKATEIAESLQEIDTHKEQAEQAATNAAQSAQSAAQAAQAAGTSASQAAQHKADAEDAADRAEAASDLADEAVEQAQTAAQTAGTAAQTAGTAAQNASTAADGAIASAAAAETRINNLAASLPEDFTELNNEVTGLKSAIEHDFSPIISLWQLSALNVSDGQPTSNASRIRTNQYISYPEFLEVKAKNNAEFLVFAYQENGTYIGVLGADNTWGTTPSWKTTFTFSNYTSYKFKLVVRDKRGTITFQGYEIVEDVIFERDKNYLKEHFNTVYNGEIVNPFEKGLSTLPLMRISYNTSTNNLNDADIYGDYLVLGLKNNLIYIYDLASKTKVSEITLSGDMNFGFNTIAFSNVFQDVSDPLPLLYARSSNNYYSVIRFTSLSTATIVKTYKFGETSDTPQAFWDFIKQKVYVISSQTPTDNRFTFTEYDLSNETLGEDGIYTLEVIRTSEIDGFGERIRQGGKFFNGKMYVGASKTTTPAKSVIFVIDPLLEIPAPISTIELGNSMLELECIAIDENRSRIIAGDYQDVFVIDAQTN